MKTVLNPRGCFLVRGLTWMSLLMMTLSHLTHSSCIDTRYFDFQSLNQVRQEISLVRKRISVCPNLTDFCSCWQLNQPMCKYSGVGDRKTYFFEEKCNWDGFNLNFLTGGYRIRRFRYYRDCFEVAQQTLNTSISKMVVIEFSKPNS